MLNKKLSKVLTLLSFSGTLFISDLPPAWGNDAAQPAQQKSGLFSSLKNKIKSAAKTVASKVKEAAPSPIKKVASTVKNVAVSGAKTVATVVKKVAPAPVKKVASVVKNVAVGAVKKVASGVKNTAQKFVTSQVSAIKGVKQSFSLLAQGQLKQAVKVGAGSVGRGVLGLPGAGTIKGVVTSSAKNIATQAKVIGTNVKGALSDIKQGEFKAALLKVGHSLEAANAISTSIPVLNMIVTPITSGLFGAGKNTIKSGALIGRLAKQIVTFQSPKTIGKTFLALGKTAGGAVLATAKAGSNILMFIPVVGQVSSTGAKLVLGQASKAGFILENAKFGVQSGIAAVKALKKGNKAEALSSGILVAGSIFGIAAQEAMALAGVIPVAGFAISDKGSAISQGLVNKFLKTAADKLAGGIAGAAGKIATKATNSGLTSVTSKVSSKLTTKAMNALQGATQQTVKKALTGNTIQRVVGGGGLSAAFGGQFAAYDASSAVLSGKQLYDLNKQKKQYTQALTAAQAAGDQNAIADAQANLGAINSAMKSSVTRLAGDTMHAATSAMQFGNHVALVQAIGHSAASAVGNSITLMQANKDVANAKAQLEESIRSGASDTQIELDRLNLQAAEQIRTATVKSTGAEALGGIYIGGRAGMFMSQGVQSVAGTIGNSAAKNYGQADKLYQQQQDVYNQAMGIDPTAEAAPAA